MVWTNELRDNTENNWQWEELNTGAQIKISNANGPDSQFPVKV